MKKNKNINNNKRNKRYKEKMKNNYVISMKNKEGIKTKSRIYGYEKKKSKRKKLMNNLIKSKHDIK